MSYNASPQVGAPLRTAQKMEAVIPAKRAHIYRSPLLSLWSRNELADNVVAFLPPSNLPKLPVIAKPFRAAQPMVLFTAARRLKVVDQMLASCVDVLREAVPDPNRFVETWARGLGQWEMHTEAAGLLQAGIVGSCLRLRGAALRTHAGLFRNFDSPSVLTARRLRIHRWSAADTTGAVGYVWLTNGIVNFSEQYVGGVYRNGGGHLCFLSRNRNALGVEVVHSTLLCRPTLGTRYDIDASFSDADADDMMTATINVYIDGQRQATRSIRSVAMTFKRMNVYNYDPGEASIGGIEVEYDVGATAS